MKKLTVAKRHCLYFVAIALFATTFFLEIPLCPFYLFLNIPCPTCGVTRAIFSLCNLDFISYFSFQPFALPLLISVWLMLHRRLFKRRRWISIFCFAIVGANFIFYLFRLRFTL